MKWLTREVELPVTFCISSLDKILAEKTRPDYHKAIEQLQLFLTLAKNTASYQQRDGRLKDVEKKVTALNEQISKEGKSLESCLNSLNFEGGLFRKWSLGEGVNYKP